MTALFRAVIAALLWSIIAASPAHAQAADRLAPGSGRFEHALAQGNPLPVYYHIPAGAGPDTPILFVMHGVKRDADRYRDEWIAHAEANRIAIFVPQFSQADYPGSANYNLGGVGKNGWAQAKDRSAYTIVDRLFDTVRAKTGSTRQRYFLYGHSAGAQFVHRMVYFMPEARIEAAIAANAGWYTMPDAAAAWPYGLGGTGIAGDSLSRALAAPLVVLLGSSDRDPNHESLRRTKEAMAQGRHRLERGLTFFDTGFHAGEPARFGWKVQIVPGAAHNNAQMAPVAVALIKEMAR